MIVKRTAKGGRAVIFSFSFSLSGVQSRPSFLTKMFFIETGSQESSHTAEVSSEQNMQLWEEE